MSDAASHAAYMREYRQKNSEKVLANERAAYERNKDKKNARRRERLANDPVYAETVRAKARQKYADCDKRKTAVKQSVANWRLKNPEKSLESKLKCLYGISLAEFKSMQDKQGLRCAICDRHENEEGRALCIDHNHATGKVRALLCTRCNSAIGFLEESEERAGKLIEYLRKHSQVQSQGYQAP